MTENPCEPCSHGFLSFRQQPIDESRIEGLRWFMTERHAGMPLGEKLDGRLSGNGYLDAVVARSRCESRGR
jgi:hypothetical protein